MRVNEVMRSEPEWVSPDITVQEAAQKLRDLEIGCLPVGENDRLVGMVTDRDIACRAVADGHDPKKTKVRAIMSKGIVYCFDDEDIDDVAQVLEQKHIHRLVVLNRKKRMIGLLSLREIAQKCPHDLTGEVLDAVSRPIH
jgi:CBS domain-containing protein